jgi:hypothetical protein
VLRFCPFVPSQVALWRLVAGFVSRLYAHQATGYTYACHIKSPSNRLLVADSLSSPHNASVKPYPKSCHRASFLWHAVWLFRAEPR